MKNEQWRRFVDIAHVIILALDDAGRVFFLNKKGRELHGYQEHELMGKNWFDHCIPDKTRQGLLTLFNKIIEGAVPIPAYHENYILTRTGEERLIAWHDAAFHYHKRTNTRLLVSSGEDITEKRKNEETLKWEFDVNKALAQLYVSLTAPWVSIEEITDRILEQALHLTGSRHGFVSSIDPGNGDNIAHTLTAMRGSQCQITSDNPQIRFSCDADGHYPTLWGHALNTREPFFTNDPANHAAASGLPDGHIPIHNFMSVPVMLGRELVGQIALTNKHGNYVARDLEACKRLAEYFALAIQRMRAEEELRQSHAELEKRISARTQDLTTLNTHLEMEIKERNRKTAALRESEHKYSALVEKALMGIFILEDGSITFANQKCTEIFGFTVEELLGMQLPLLVDRGGVNSLYEELDKLVRQEQSHHEMMLRCHTKDNKAIWVTMLTTVISYANKKVILGNVIDVTRRQELEYLVRIQDKMTSLGRVAAGIAHELRNPLTGINLHLTNLGRIIERIDCIDPEKEENIKKILANLLKASGKIESVVRRVYDFARPAMHRPVMVDVNKAIREVMQISEVTMRQKEIMMSVRLDDSAPVCMANQNLFEQLLMNLLTNAAQILEKTKSDGKKILITSVAGAKVVVITVEDSGPGVSPDLRERIFDPFFTSRWEGLGIGLSICHRIVKDHGGTLGVTGSETLGGAKFTFSLPIENGEG